MKASKFTDAQKTFILRQAEDGVPIGDICRKARRRITLGARNTPA